MIGQVKLLEKINKMESRFPRFTIVCGPKGSGKKTIVNLIISKLKLIPINIANKVDDIRNVIDLANKKPGAIGIIFSDADNMSLAAKNSLLKLTEEPPNNVYIFLTLESLSNTLDTIKSRGTVLELDPYSPQEIMDYREYRRYSNTHDDLISSICMNTREVDELFKYDISGFYSFAEQIIEYIHIPNSGNVFKITKKLKVKDTDSGYDTYLFFKLIERLFFDKGTKEKEKKYLKAALETNKILTDLTSTVISKQGILDLWIMNVRKVLRAQ